MWGVRMRIRRIAILIDAGFFLKRLPKLVARPHRNTPDKVARIVNLLCRTHVLHLTEAEKTRWHDHVYRIFFYDAVPYSGQAHHPLKNQQIDFGKTDEAQFRRALFDCLRRQRKLALRLGKVTREGDWSPPTDKVRRLLPTRDWLAGLDLEGLEHGGQLTLTAQQAEEAVRLQKRWNEIDDDGISLGLRQKGVDMRIGLDIASITLKQQADTIILISGDSDFVPAAKLARREGVEFILDPLWQSVNEDLFEHIDGLHSGLSRPTTQANAGIAAAIAEADQAGADQGPAAAEAELED